MKEKLLKELIVVLFSIDYQNTDHICERFDWQENRLELEFNLCGEDNMKYFCSSHIIGEFGTDPDITGIGRSGIEHRIIFEINFDGLDDLFEELLDTIDITDDQDYKNIRIWGDGIYDKMPIDLFKMKIKDTLIDAVYGTAPLTMESLAIKILSKTEFSHKGIADLIRYSEIRGKEQE